LYRTPGAGLAGRVSILSTMIVLALAAGAGCKKRGADLLADPDERGKLPRMAQHLEEAYANAVLPTLTEPASFADRLEKWDDFRGCTVRAYVARKRESDRLARAGQPRPQRAASIGDEAVEECAVEMAVVKKDPSVCERLAMDYAGPNGEQQRAAARCWDTHARIFGKPDECPVVWMPADLPARNPECLALARRDQSLCPFAESPGRCRALLTGDSASCGAPDAADDCQSALTYWRGLIPAGAGPLLVDPAAFQKDDLLYADFELSWEHDQHPHARLRGPKRAAGVSWPVGRTRPAWTEDTTQSWGGRVPDDAAQITWRVGEVWVKLAFVPGGATKGTLPLQPLGPGAPATVALVWAGDPREFRRCAPGPQSRGQVHFEAAGTEPGSFVTGTAEAQRLACTDGGELNLKGKFRLVILDVR
jgi:hypothetical protein